MSSSESEDENLKQFVEAVDTQLFNNEFYKPKEERKVEQKTELKSQRNIESTENIFQSELNISEDMKKFIGKKISKLIDESVEFVDVKKRKINDEPVDCVKLLKGCKEYVSLEVDDRSIFPQVKIPIKRRTIEDDNLKESLKIEQAATNVNKINKEVSLWTKKNRHDAIRFKKSADGKTSHVIEKQNEFSKIRAKNGWNESKIKDAKYFNKGVGSLIKEK